MILATPPSPGLIVNCSFSVKLLPAELVYLLLEASNQTIITFCLWVGANVLLGHKSK